MKMEEVIQKVSAVYREGLGEAYDLRSALRQVEAELYDAEYNGGKNTTLAKYKALTAERERLKYELIKKDQYCDGISCVRELLMDLGFDTEVL